MRIVLKKWKKNNNNKNIAGRQDSTRLNLLLPVCLQGEGGSV